MRVIFKLVIVLALSAVAFGQSSVFVSNPPGAPIPVDIKSGSSSGVQYQDGATQASPTGTLIFGKTAANILRSIALDGFGNLNVNCVIGCGAGSTTPSDAFVNPTTASVQATFPFVWNGTTWDRWRGDATNGAWVNVKLIPTHGVTQSGAWNVGQQGTWTVGQQGIWIVQPGNTPNTTPWIFTIQQGGNSATVDVGGRLKVFPEGTTTPADTFTNPTTVNLQAAFPFLWNGSTWDRWRGDTTNGAWVNVKQIPTVQAQSVGNGAVLANQQSVTASAVALASNACRRVAVKALSTNSISVYVGPSGVTTGNGYELAPGESISLDVTNTNLIYVIASTTGAKVSWIATN